MTPIGSGRTSSLLLTLGIFLKLLGFFIVLFSYAEFEPSKLQQAEFSLKQRFNVTIPVLDRAVAGRDVISLAPVQNMGQIFDGIESDLRGTIDFMAVSRRVETGDLSLTVRADQIFDLNDTWAKSPGFAGLLNRSLQKNRAKNMFYTLEIVSAGGQDDILMRANGHFAQKMVVAGFNQRHLSIGHEHKRGVPTVTLRIRGVKR